jgi:hypothetical protein
MRVFSASEIPTQGSSMNRSHRQIVAFQHSTLDLVLNTQAPVAGIVDGIHFVSWSQRDQANWLVVYGDLPEQQMSSVPWERRILLLTEPPTIKKMPTRFIDQFGIVVGPMSKGIGTYIRSHSALTWFYPLENITRNTATVRHTFEALVSMKHPEKTLAASVVLSRKNRTPEHKSRLALVDKLQRRLGDKLHIFGAGFNPISCKADAIDPYRVHLCLENNSLRDFFTEKITDCFLGYSYPLYAGCPNLADYFPRNSFSSIDLGNADTVASLIERILDDPDNLERKQAINEARRRVLYQHSLPALVSRIVAAISPNVRSPQLSTQESIQPSHFFQNGIRTFLKKRRLLLDN